MRGITVTTERGERERRGGAKRQRGNNFGSPWNMSGKLKGGGGLVGTWSFSMTATGRERKSRLVVSMMGQETRDAQVGE